MGMNVKVYGCCFDQASPKAQAVQASPDPPKLAAAPQKRRWQDIESATQLLSRRCESPVRR